MLLVILNLFRFFAVCRRMRTGPAVHSILRYSRVAFSWYSVKKYHTHQLIILCDLWFWPRWVLIFLQYMMKCGSVNRYRRILIYIQQDATLHSLFYLETALHVSGGTTTHYQERKQLYLQHLVCVTSLLLPAAIVEELELVWVCCGWPTPPTAHSNRFHLFHDSGR